VIALSGDEALSLIASHPLDWAEPTPVAKGPTPSTVGSVEFDKEQVFSFIGTRITELNLFYF